MESGLKSLSKLFSERVFRIPDYQRGFSWGKKQLREFWSDIELLQNGQHHYCGVLTLEVVPPEKWKAWDEDAWLIQSKSYQPFFIVDGQQRITSLTILIQCIIESMKSQQTLNFSTKEEIQSKYIHISGGTAHGSFLFGYEKDNPSYNCLVTKVLNKTSGRYSAGESTIYTKNLLAAKEYLKEQVARLNKDQVESLFSKVSQSLLFNVFHIEKEVDVHVAFETMNNRGLQLSNLELLKNRLIYLTTQLGEANVNKFDLRRNINNSWKTVYYYLGKNSQESLSDDFYLVIHFALYFGKKLLLLNEKIFDHGFFDIDRRAYYKQFLLDEEFTVKRIHSHKADEKLTSTDIYNYALDLKRNVENHYQIAFPEESTLGAEEKLWLSRLRRLLETTHSKEISALLLVAFSKKGGQSISAEFLKAVERYFFILSLLPYRFRQKNGKFKVTREVVIATTSKDPAKHLEDKLNEVIQDLTNSPTFPDALMEGLAEAGYYGWGHIRYFLYEYECHLKLKAKRKSDKIDWKLFVEDDIDEDHSSLEHILPQSPSEQFWKDRIKGLSAAKIKKLTNSLGNLVATSTPRNSSLKNKPFPDKCGLSGSKTGYRFGSYSEVEVSMHADWGLLEILNRGLTMLTFLESRWGINLGDDATKKKALGLDFIT